MTTLSINEDLLEQINAEAQSEAHPVAETGLWVRVQCLLLAELVNFANV